LPPSVLYSQSYAARRAATWATTFAAPETLPQVTVKAGARRVGVLRTATPALSMIEAAFVGSPSLIAWT
jgi:hypothetical protein